MKQFKHPPITYFLSALAIVLSIELVGCEKQASNPGANGIDLTDMNSPEDSVPAKTKDDNPEVGGFHLFKPEGSIRFATFNVALNRKNAGQLISELEGGKSDAAKKLAEVIQHVRPDILLLNEFDFDSEYRASKAFQELYLSVPQNGEETIEFNFAFSATVNTGVESGLDLDGDGKLGEPEDSFGYGAFPGQYGMVVLSRFPIDLDNLRTFQNFLWRDIPDAIFPMDPESNQEYYSTEIKRTFRLSSKSLWDVPIKIGKETIHLVCAHPTPPAFDGPEDRNGLRNHAEIQLIADYVSDADYIYDDAGRKGGIGKGASFVIVGDMNADPNDGDSHGAAARLIVDHELVCDTKPRSGGAAAAARKSGKANLKHTGNPSEDTGDFNDYKVGNLRIDYVLPSCNLMAVKSGVFWPSTESRLAHLTNVSDHHMVWVDIRLKP